MVVAFLIAMLTIFGSLGCVHHCMQAQPSCKLKPYAIVEFVNRTDVDKVTYMQRFYDNKRLGAPTIEIVKAHTVHRYRLPPGIYEFGVKTLDGKLHAWITKSALGPCDTVVVSMKQTKIPEVDKPIKSRRSIQ